MSLQTQSSEETVYSHREQICEKSCEYTASIEQSKKNAANPNYRLDEVFPQCLHPIAPYIDAFSPRVLLSTNVESLLNFPIFVFLVA